jgi:hypothetical protein
MVKQYFYIFAKKKFKMQINFKTIAAALAMITQLSAATAQESLNTAGGVDRGRGGSVSYSVGQLVYTTETTQAGAMAQGVQRPYRVSVIENSVSQSQPVFESVVFPNPTGHDLFLQITSPMSENLHYRLIDMSGKQLSSASILAPLTQIPMENLAAGIYLLQVFDTNPNPLQTLQIIKN